MTISRRTFSATIATIATIATGAAVAMLSPRSLTAASMPKARNVVLVHGLFADGSCWLDVIARLQAQGLNTVSVQNPLTNFPDAVDSARRVLDRMDGPTVFVGHSFSGMILSEAGVHPNVTALVYVAARAPDAGEDYAALAKTYPAPPASAGIVCDGEEGRLSEGGLPARFRRRRAGGAGPGPACRATTVQQATACGENHAGSMAHEAQFLCRFHAGSYDQP